MGLKSFAKTVARSRTATFMVPPPLLGAKTYFGRREASRLRGLFFGPPRGFPSAALHRRRLETERARERASLPPGLRRPAFTAYPGACRGRERRLLS